MRKSYHQEKVKMKPVEEHSNTLVVFETRWENLTAKTSSPEQHSAFKEL